MESKVSARLQEGLAPELLELVFRPRLEAEFATAFAPMIRLNLAHAVALIRAGIIDEVTGRELLRGIAAVAADGAGAIRPDPNLEDPYFNIEAAIVARVGPATGGRLHIGRSRNDLGAALARMQCREALLEITDALLALRAALLEAAKRHADAVMPGHTHLQPAQPSTFGFLLLGLADAFARDAARLSGAWPRLNLSPLGAAAMTGSSFPLDRALLAALLGFEGLIEHTQDAIASRDFGIEMLAACTGIALTWSRLAQDFFVMITHEFGTLDLPDRVAGTSSIMPQKKNPVVVEQLKARAGGVLAAFVAAAGAVKGSHFSMTVDGCREALRPAGEAFRDTVASLRLARLLVETAEPRRERMLALADADFSTATDLADAMVRDAGLSFREAHHVAGGAVRLAMDRGLTAGQITPALVDEAARAVLGRALALDAATVRRSLDPTLAVLARATVGGPAPAEVRRRAAEAQAALRVELGEHEARRAGLRAASEALDAAVARIAG